MSPPKTSSEMPAFLGTTPWTTPSGSRLGSGLPAASSSSLRRASSSLALSGRWTTPPLIPSALYIVRSWVLAVTTFRFHSMGKHIALSAAAGSPNWPAPSMLR